MELNLPIKNGIILAGGTGSRLFPLTTVVSKQLLNVNGRFIIDYPIQSLKELGVENITVIVGSSFAGQILDYLKDGERFGIKFNYIYQAQPDGISSAINLCKRFVSDDDKFCVVLGDNIYENKIELGTEEPGAKIVLHENKELKRFGVATINSDGKIFKIEEKPKILDENNKNYAITGCYVFDQMFFDYFAKTAKSDRGEYEIVDIIRSYHFDGKLGYTVVDGDWTDAGTIDSLNYLNKRIHTPRF